MTTQVLKTSGSNWTLVRSEGSTINNKSVAGRHCDLIPEHPCAWICKLLDLRCVAGLLSRKWSRPWRNVTAWFLKWRKPSGMHASWRSAWRRLSRHNMPCARYSFCSMKGDHPCDDGHAILTLWLTSHSCCARGISPVEGSHLQQDLSRPCRCVAAVVCLLVCRIMMHRLTAGGPAGSLPPEISLGCRGCPVNVSLQLPSCVTPAALSMFHSSCPVNVSLQLPCQCVTPAALSM